MTTIKIFLTPKGLDLCFVAMITTTQEIRKVPELKCIWKRAPSIQGEFYALHFASVADIPEDVWNAALENGSSFLNLNYLRALEEAHDGGLELRYVMFRDHEENFIGVSAFQITHFMTSEDAYSNAFLKWLNKVTQFIRRGHIHNILICGNAFATGEHGFHFNQSLSGDEQVRLVLDAMFQISDTERKKGRPICAMLAKDFYPTSSEISKAFSKRKFSAFQVDHNMVMPIRRSWMNFEDYMADLNTKCRTKAKSAYKRSEKITIKRLNASAIREYAERMQELYNAVYEKADFRLGKLNIHGLEGIHNPNEGDFTVCGYFLEEKMVGFSTSMKNGQSLEAHVIGIDYSVNRDYAIYQRMLYNYVELAIELKVDRIIFGRTAAEIKSTIGAVPVDLTCCVFHPKKISNALLNLILNYVKPSDYPHRNPWRADVEEQLKSFPIVP